MHLIKNNLKHWTSAFLGCLLIGFSAQCQVNLNAEYSELFDQAHDLEKRDIESLLNRCSQFEIKALKNDDSYNVVRISLLKKNLFITENNNQKAVTTALTTYNSHCLNPSEEVCKPCGDLVTYLIDYMHLLDDSTNFNTYSQRYLNSPCGKNDINFRINLNYTLAKRLIRDSSFNEALRIVQSGIEELKTKHQDELLIRAYNQLGLIAISAKEYDLAIESYYQSLHYIDKTQRRLPLKPTLLGNIGNAYFQKGDFVTAHKFLLLDAEGSIANGNIGSNLSAQIALSKIEEEWKMNDQAIKRLKEAIVLYNKNNEATLECQHKSNALFQLASIYEKEGDLKNALKYSKEYRYFNDSITKATIKENKNLILNISKNNFGLVSDQLKSENELIKFELKLAKQEKESTEFKWKTLVFSCTVLLILLTIIFRSQRKNNRRKLQIKEEKLIAAQQRAELKKLQQKTLELELKSSRENLSLLSIELKLKSEFPAQLSKKLNELTTLTTSDARSLKIFIENELDLKSMRLKTQKDIDRIGERFFTLIRQKHTTLTDLESKLCGMVVMKLTNKEISISRNVEVESVKMARNRLKKKLNIPKESSLYSYLIQFTAESE